MRALAEFEGLPLVFYFGSTKVICLTYELDLDALEGRMANAPPPPPLSMEEVMEGVGTSVRTAPLAGVQSVP